MSEFKAIYVQLVKQLETVLDTTQKRISEELNPKEKLPS